MGLVIEVGCEVVSTIMTDSVSYRYWCVYYTKQMNISWPRSLSQNHLRMNRVIEFATLALIPKIVQVICLACVVVTILFREVMLQSKIVLRVQYVGLTITRLLHASINTYRPLPPTRARDTV